MNKKVNDIIEVTIEKLTFNGGRGLARFEDFVIFVPFTVPGERVSARITKIKKTFAEAEALQILELSKNRIPPPCPLFKKCGGCTWQHLAYPAQVQAKEDILNSFLNQLIPNKVVDHFYSSPEEFHYRNRIQVQAKNGRNFFRKRGSNELVEIKDCLLAHPKINNELKTFKLASKRPERVEIALNTENQIEIIKQNFKAKKRLFSQVNQRQNLQLIEQVLKIVKSIPTKNIFDLYCGNGNFSFPLKQHFPTANVTGVELSQSSIQQAKNTAQKTALNIDFKAESVEHFLSEAHFLEDDLCIVDPPRVGLSSHVLDAMVLAQPKHIIYISCNPSTLIRDAKALLSSGYQLKTTLGFDMFPQTDHIEALLYLSID